MRIGIDMTALVTEHTGVDVSITNLVLALSKADSQNRYFLFVNSADRKTLRDCLPKNFEVLTVSTRSRLIRLLAQQIVFPILSYTLRLDVIHSPAFIGPIFRGRSRRLLTIHDMTFFSIPSHHTTIHRSRLFQQAVFWSIDLADKICVPSFHVRDELTRYSADVSPDKIRVVNWGIEDAFYPRPTEERNKSLKALGISFPYIVHVGTVEPRKNLPHLLSSFRFLVKEFGVAEHLVLSGRLGWDYAPVLDAIESDDLAGRVHLLGYVEQVHLPALYSGSRLCVYPSLAEGFGFPPLEAMACGVPVIASDSSSLVELLQGAAELISSDDERGLALAMAELLSNDSLRARRIELGLLRAAEFTWERAARRTLECYSELADSQ